MEGDGVEPRRSRGVGASTADPPQHPAATPTPRPRNDGGASPNGGTAAHDGPADTSADAPSGSGPSGALPEGARSEAPRQDDDDLADSAGPAEPADPADPDATATAADGGLEAPTTAVSAAAPTPEADADPAARIDGPTMHVRRAPARPAAARRHPRRAPAAPQPARPASGPFQAAGGTEAIPGTMIVDRYRLVSEVGQDRWAGAALWKARDVTLERDVAITLLTGGWQADARASSTLARGTRNAQFEHPHAARVLDVVRPGGARLPHGVLGAAVAEWTPGRDLTSLVADGPLRPSAALRVIEQLADAVAEAHRSGLVLGMEHPRRVRVTGRGSARLAFPLARGEATVADDVQGLGALMYLLLTGRWPAGGVIGGSTPMGLTAAPRRSDGGPVPARQVRPDLPVELGALVDRTLDGAGGIRTAAAVHRLVGQMREGVEDGGVLLPVLEDGQPIDDEGAWHTEDEPDEEADPTRRRKLRIGVTLLVLATLAIVAFVAVQVVQLFGGGSSSTPPLVVPAEAPPVPGPGPAGAAPPPPAAPSTGPVTLSTVAVYAPSGNPDNSDQVDQAVDGDPATTWSTSQYRQQFPALKPGVGVMATFAAPSTVSEVSVTSPSPGTRIEVRSASAPDVPLSQTELLGSGTVPESGTEGGDSADGGGAGEAGEAGDAAPATVDIALQPGQPTGHLLIWITALGEDDGSFASEIAEVTIQR